MWHPSRGSIVVEWLRYPAFAYPNVLSFLCRQTTYLFQSVEKTHLELTFSTSLPLFFRILNHAVVSQLVLTMPPRFANLA